MSTNVLFWLKSNKIESFHVDLRFVLRSKVTGNGIPRGVSAINRTTLGGIPLWHHYVARQAAHGPRPAKRLQLWLKENKI